MVLKWHEQFSQWTGQEVILTWNLQPDRQLPDYRGWIEAPHTPVPPEYEGLLNRLQDQLCRMAQAWNETELLARFIGPVLELIDFSGPRHKFFLERNLSARFERGIVSGTVDGLVASGLDAPVTPYFFLHEYKKMKGSEVDPQGQLLIAMLAAQHLNAEGGPLYGCYIVGKYWTFVYLEGTTFAESQGYDASDAGELRIIWNILHETKRRIEARVALTFDQL